MTRKTGTEINFDKRYGGGRPKGAEAAGKGAGGELVFCWSFQSDFTNEMDIWYPADRVGSKRLPCRCFLTLPSMAMSPCIFDHFISEIADWKQQQKNQLPASPFPSCFRPFWPPSAMVLIKIDFLGKWMADIEMDCQDVKACPSLRFLDFLPLLPDKYGTSHFLPYCHRH